jgi:putative hemolysin
MEKRRYIDLDKVLKNRSPKTYKRTPRFLVNWLKRIIHQEEMNEHLRNNEGVLGQDFLKSTIEFFDVRVKYAGIENVPKGKKYVFASNHPLGGLDGITILNLIFANFGYVKAIVNDLLLYIENLKPVFTGVNVFGRFSKQQIKDMEDLYASDNQIVVFPAGLVSRKVHGKIQDLEWKKSFLVKSLQYKRDIVPVYTVGRNRNFFYNFAKFRKFLGIKFGLELIFLPKEMFKYRGKELIFKFGEPIPYQKLAEMNIKEAVKYVRQKSDELKNKNFDKYYTFVPVREKDVIN